MILAHKIRLVPTPRQETYFRRACGTSRFVWNEALSMWKAAYEAGEKPSGRALRVQFNATKYQRFPWLKSIHRDAHSRPFDNLQAAFSRFFRRVQAGQTPGYPQFKKKGKCKDSFYVANDLFRFDGNRVRLPKLGWVRMREPLRLTGKVMGATVSRTANQWHLAVQVEVGDIKKPRTSDGTVGVDLGVKSSAVLSTGEVIQGPKALKSNLKRLRRLSRQHSRKVKGSSNRKKSTLKLARLHLKITNLRADHTHKLTTRLCRENQAIGIEDLAVGNMVRNRRLARSIQDEGWGQFRWQLGYKAPMFGSEVTVHDRWFPSSKTCSTCGLVREGPLPLSVRRWTCGGCETLHDRDLNAAINLRPTIRGHRSSYACGERKAQALSTKQESSSRQPERLVV